MDLLTQNANKLKDQPASEAKQLRTYAQIIPGMELRLNLNDNKTSYSLQKLIATK
jgi:hypothetical protein